MSATVRQNRARNTREALLDNALKLLLEEGVNEFSMNKIAKRTGIAQPSFYNHFRNLDQLLAELRERMRKRYLSPLQDLTKAKVSAETAVKTEDSSFNLEVMTAVNRLFIEQCFQSILADIDVFRLILKDHQQNSGPVGGKLGVILDEINQEWIRFFTALLAEQGIPVAKQEMCLYVDCMSALIHSLVLGCDGGRYHQSKAIEITTRTSCVLLADLFPSYFPNIQP
ncbi:transcriptional regulator [Oleiphilus messinensis]|uniref:Transcriptional regulator n=1 Tax=Oleiphilus messinensis TaxID=141451 RepID=A0A1Y0IEM4_9GAMM|nr:TetR/AcrR family transcriptional regulator [Oleiphilus messinensis]ARU58988.1 transcriptional regulator [Oleiphilus messinensis]